MKTVLYIENSKGLVVFARQVITETGHGFEAVGSGAAAIARLDLDPLPDLVLCDLLLEDGNGVEVLEHLGDMRFDEVAVVVLTGSTRTVVRSVLHRPPLRYFPIVVKPAGIAAVGELFRTAAAWYLDPRWDVL